MEILPLPQSSTKQTEKRNIWIEHHQSPSKVDELNELTEMLYDLVVNVKFKKYSNEFQAKLKEDIRKIANESKMFIAVDKTTNFYKVTKEKHDELLKKEINKDYKKTDWLISKTSQNQIKK